MASALLDGVRVVPAQSVHVRRVRDRHGGRRDLGGGVRARTREMATWKRALGGAIAGAWLAMFPLGFRLFE
jgi:hypothetical protein